ncbi:hypothetical protein QQS21_004500 [Conoideocrella luteorostrata]|uniref:Enterotoxin n=1 Tax=Conoideocrella luteorostrata TaxID=1105319 RepID=A0AAJ0CS52_9HYPO|nr:hypothetical protein QQS21_004500 [Conoideocrella luteorostrata]
MSMDAHELVYLASGHAMDTPARVQIESGITEFENTSPDTDEAWGYDTNAEESGFTLVTRSFDEARHHLQSFQRGWIFRIAASPNMVPLASFKGYTHAALGGVLWSQVQTYAPTDSSWEDNSAGFRWQNNSDYDPRWEHYGANGQQPLLSGVGRPANLTSLQLATQFMNELTSRQNHLLGVDQCNTLRELLDWNPDSEPTRDFPLIRHRQPESLQSMALRQFDWTTVNIPPYLQMVMAEGIPTAAQCLQTSGELKRAYLGNSPEEHRRSDDGMAEQDDCDKLASTIQQLPLPQDEQVNNETFTCDNVPFYPDPATIVFYGDYLWPEEAKKQGGFLPFATPPPGPAYDVEGLDPTTNQGIEMEFENYLLPTYLSFGQAAKHAAIIASGMTEGFAGVVYVVQATPNMVSSGKESVAVGGIRWSQVLGWMQIPQGYSPPEYDAAARAKLQQHFEHAFNETKDLFQPNKDYNPDFDLYQTTTDVQYDLNTPQDLVAFMNRNGQAVGWQGHFPLFEHSHTAQSETSMAAKTQNAVPVPHDPSAWEGIKKYVKSHAVALALLPAAVAFAFVPGLGEAADAAELAALCTESVESIEMAEASSSLTEVGSGLTQLLRGAAKLKVD